MIDPEIGFTSDVIKDPRRFVGRVDLIRDCIKALNTPLGLIAIYGKRGVGKSSLMRQIQQMALGDYALATNAGIYHEVPRTPRKYLTVYYSCDSMIINARQLLNRLCSDQEEEDGLLRLVPNAGKELIEFQRSAEFSSGIDLKVATWGNKGIESSTFAKVVKNDEVQTFRNFINAVVAYNVKKRMGRDALFILLDEFDVIQDKKGIGSLIKSLSSPSVKFAVCGVGRELSDLVVDHASVERLLEEGLIHVRPMNAEEATNIIKKAETLFQGSVRFEESVTSRITELSQGLPYLVQLVGKECINIANQTGESYINEKIFSKVLQTIKEGVAFPTLEAQYQKAISRSPQRELLLQLLAEQPEAESAADFGEVYLKDIRAGAREFDIDNVDQLLPRLIDRNYGPVLYKIAGKQGVYEFVNPVFRVYVKLRR